MKSRNNGASPAVRVEKPGLGLLQQVLLNNQGVNTTLLSYLLKSFHAVPGQATINRPSGKR